MRLADLRKLSIRKKVQIHFRLRNGLECVVTQHGLAQVPELRKVPDFNLEDELASASEFLFDPVPVPGDKHPARPQSLTREQLESMLSAGLPASAGAHPDHEED